LPDIVKTETVPSLRFATNASVPALLIDTPAALNHGELVVRRDLLWVGRIDFERSGHKREAFIAGQCDTLRRPNNAGWRLHFANHFRR
jgi:hypothetical protein